MKRKIFAALIIAACFATSCDKVIEDITDNGNADNENIDDTGENNDENGGDIGEEPGNGNEDTGGGSTVSVKLVSSVEYKYTDHVYDNGSNHYTLTYKYDSEDRVVRIEEVCDSPDEWDDFKIYHTFDYTVVDEVSIKSEYIEGGYEEDPVTWIASLKDGRVKTVELQGEYEAWDEYKHEFSYDEDGYFVRLKTFEQASDAYMQELSYTDGMLTGMTSYEPYDEDSEMTFDPAVYYPSRYPNDKINVDLNMFLLNGGLDIEDDIVSNLVALRMCGNFGNYYIETSGGDYTDYANAVDFTNDPDYFEHVKQTRHYLIEEPIRVSYEFDADGCPVTLYYEDVYEQYTIEYDLVADVDNPMKERDDIVCYPLIKKNYTSTKDGNVVCPTEYTITYR